MPMADMRACIEKPPEMVGIRKNRILLRQKSTTGIHHVNTRQMVFHGDLLCPQMFFYGKPHVSAAFYRGIIGDNHRLLTVDYTNSGYNTC